MPIDGLIPLLVVPVIALTALRARAVSSGGALAGGLVGGLIAAGTGWPGLAMLATLLLLGTLVSSRSRRGRDALQVLCNGGAASVAALAAGLGHPWGWAAAAGGLSAALSDTVSGELGRRWGGRPRALLLGRALRVGADGGMSWAGTGLGAAAALMVPAVGQIAGAPFGIAQGLSIGAAGLVGNLLDSVLGLTLQPRLGTRGNDWTNLIATLGGAGLAVCLSPPA
jgi:uncharacterized membrane protein